MNGESESTALLADGEQIRQRERKTDGSPSRAVHSFVALVGPLFAPLFAPLLGAPASPAAAPAGEECLGSFVTIFDSCSCGGSTCSATVQVTPTLLPDCGGCRFDHVLTSECGGLPCNDLDVGAVTMSCISQEKLFFPCPGNPQFNIVEVGLYCGSCQ